MSSVRATYIYTARVYLREASARRKQTGFWLLLTSWAADCRRKAMKAEKGELF